MYFLHLYLFIDLFNEKKPWNLLLEKWDFKSIYISLPTQVPGFLVSDTLSPTLQSSRKHLAMCIRSHYCPLFERPVACCLLMPVCGSWASRKLKTVSAFVAPPSDPCTCKQ